jgi:hypothetical protein
MDKSEKVNNGKVLINTFKCGKIRIYNTIKNKIKIKEVCLIGKFISNN